MVVFEPQRAGLEQEQAVRDERRVVLRAGLGEIGQAILAREGERRPDAHRRRRVVLVVVPRLAEVVEVVPDRGRRRVPVVDVRGLDVQRVERVSHHREVVEAVERLAFAPDPLREPGPEVVGGHAPVGAVKERIVAGHRARAGQREVPGAQREPLAEPEARVAGRGRDQGRARGEEQDVEVQPLIEGVAGEVEDVARQLDVVALLDVVHDAVVVGVRRVRRHAVRVLELRHVVEHEPERHPAFAPAKTRARIPCRSGTSASCPAASWRRADAVPGTGACAAGGPAASVSFGISVGGGRLRRPGRRQRLHGLHRVRRLRRHGRGRLLRPRTRGQRRQQQRGGDPRAPHHDVSRRSVVLDVLDESLVGDGLHRPGPTRRTSREIRPPGPRRRR